MARFEIGAFAEVIASGRIGEVIARERKNVTVEFSDESCIEPEVLDFKDCELKLVELPRLKTSQLRSLVRGKTTVSELTNGVNIIPGYLEIDAKDYKINVLDLLTGVKSYVDRTPEEVYSWIENLMIFSDEMSFPCDTWENIQDAVTEKDILAYAFDEIEAIKWRIYDDELSEMSPEDFKDLKDLLEQWIESSGKEYPDVIKYKIAGQYDCDSIDKQSEATQELFKKCLDYCCDIKRNPESIQRRGYCYYCGTNIYPNDWIKARDAFIDYYQLTGDASAANTLGYIYYYGRCNGGVPEYEEAFKYFSIGHAYTYFESTYKLADMLAHGYGVVKDGESANRLYWGVYQQTSERFIKGDLESKFADAALRMGNCFRDAIGTQKDLETAYYYYLQADYAIRERTRVANHYGDTVVFNGVQKALADVRNEYTKTGRIETFYNPGWIKWTLIDHRRCKLIIKELKDGVLAIDASPMKRRKEKEAPKMLITVPKADYCELRKKIRIKTAPGSKYGTTNEKSEIIFDSYEYDWRKGKTVFYLYDERVGEIVTDYYTFTAPAQKKSKPSGEVYHFVSVIFEESGRSYDYLCDDKAVAVGDLVVINGYDGEKTVKVVAVSDKYESELGLPIERYKKIVRRG